MDDPRKTAEGIEEVARMLMHYARVLRDEQEDLTGFGCWRILCDRLERVMKCKVITREQHAAFIRLSDAEFRRQGGQTSY
jgi:hypothetical protein